MKQQKIMITPKFKIDDEVYFLCNETIFKRKVNKILAEVSETIFLVRYGLDDNNFTYINEKELFINESEIILYLKNNINYK